MPVVEAEVVVGLEPTLAFAVSQTQAPLRYRWDPFVRPQHLATRRCRPRASGRSPCTASASG